LLSEAVSAEEWVALPNRNVPEYCTLFFGAGMINAVTLAVNWRLAAPEMEYILNHARAKVLFIGEEFLGHLALMKLETVKRVVVIKAEGGDAGSLTWSLCVVRPLTPGPKFGGAGNEANRLSCGGCNREVRSWDSRRSDGECCLPPRSF
jgi:long-chain acyl-CoA synthetase